MSFGQGGPQSQWDPWKPQSQQPWGGNVDDDTPDWAALADQAETRNRRKRLLLIGGGALATVAVGTAVAMAVMSANGDDTASGQPTNLPASGSLPSAGASSPSFAPTSAPPPLDPKDFISSKTKDTAPLSPEILFPGTQLTAGSTVYKKGPTADTTNCASVTSGTLPKALTASHCTRLMRVTYVKDDIAVTVGVALFDTEAQAAKAIGQADTKSVVRSLSGKGVKAFCEGAVCRTTTNSYGRYAYFTTAGFTNGKDVTTKDTKVFTMGDALGKFAFDQIHQRGEAQASAAASQ
ncbi:hypothetical protein ABZT04_45855 [Streptomyces sp. NPDC005492]|uniref:hypothetical protein n=1 Tax=Streptomyces sp. NPDC005492 TaxID=3156883 RepID=UPI0033AFF1FB